MVSDTTLEWVDKIIRGETPGWPLNDRVRELLMDLVAEIRFLKGHGADAEPAEPLTHLQFPGGRYEERYPLCVKVRVETWHVAQPCVDGRVYLWPLPEPWQEWLEAEGGWRFVWSEVDGWTLEYVR